ncbi:hypothetical protein AABB24_001678, partial [Solanum stoloniferum]
SSFLDLFDDHSAKEQQVILQNICMNNYMLQHYLQEYQNIEVYSVGEKLVGLPSKKPQIVTSLKNPNSTNCSLNRIAFSSAASVAPNAPLNQETMNAQMQDALSPPQVKATFRLGSESYSVEACKGILSEQLISMKEQSMTILKDYITKHNVPNEVPDEPEEFSSEDDGEIPEQPPVKSKKRK